MSDREKELDHKIEVCRIRLDNTNGCFRNVMRGTGALQGKEPFVKSRIVLRIYTVNLLSDIDKQINDINNMLERFKKDDEEWARKR